MLPFALNKPVFNTTCPKRLQKFDAMDNTYRVERSKWTISYIRAAKTFGVQISELVHGEWNRDDVTFPWRCVLVAMVTAWLLQDTGVFSNTRTDSLDKMYQKWEIRICARVFFTHWPIQREWLIATSLTNGWLVLFTGTVAIIKGNNPNRFTEWTVKVRSHGIVFSMGFSTAYESIHTEH